MLNYEDVLISLFSTFEEKISFAGNDFLKNTKQEGLLYDHI